MYIFRIRTEGFYKINMTFIENDIHRKDEKNQKTLHKKIIKTRFGNSFHQKFSIYFCLDILLE